MTDEGSVISGRVHLPDGRAVSEARVSIASSPVPTPDVALLTDDDGRFELRAPTAGRYEVAIHADGLDPQVIQIDAREGEPRVAMDVELSPQT